MVYLAQCKDCRVDFYFTKTALELDVARGLSQPERCVACRAKNARFVRASGAAYWDAPIEIDDAKRCWGNYGLGRLVRDLRPVQEIPYEGVPVGSPPEKFKTIAPAADALVRNLEDPNGTQVSILVGPTGTGKSTWVPYRILKSKIGQEGRICVTQPRLVTLKREPGPGDDTTTPGYIAKHLLGAPSVGGGQEIGFLYRGESTQQDRYTKLLFITDGILIRWLTTGEIGKFRVVVVDEAHEQSSNMELIFALMRYKLPLFPQLKLVIASATIAVEKFQDFFGNGDPKGVFLAKPDSAVIEIRTSPDGPPSLPEVDRSTPHPIYDRFPDGPNGYATGLPGLKLPSEPEEVPAAAAALMSAIRNRPGFTKLEKPRGDIIIFVSTLALVDATIRAVEALGLPQVQVLACHAQISEEELKDFKRAEKAAQKAFDERKIARVQRVIVATNYAETSVTISNLCYVIESGYIMEPQWDTETESFQYASRRHSRAGCTQRKGRVGRIQPGECFRLYTRAHFLDSNVFPPSTVPAISREPLDKFFLTAKVAGVYDLGTFKWLGYDETRTEEIARSSTALSRRGVLDAEGDITKRAVELQPIEASTIDLSLFMAESDKFACSLEVATFLAFTNQPRGPFDRGEAGGIAYQRWRSGCLDDLEFYLRVFHHWSRQGSNEKRKQWAKKEGLNHKALTATEDSRERNLKQFTRRTHTNPAKRELDLARLHRVRLVLARCMPEWTYTRDEKGPANTFVPLHPERISCNKPVELDRESCCLAVGDLKALVCVERAKVFRGGGFRLFARHVVRIEPEWIDFLTKAGAASLALLLKQSVAQVSGQAAMTTATIQSAPPPVPDVNRFQVGELISNLRAIRSLASEGDERRDRWLAEMAKNRAPVIVDTVRSRLSCGLVFQGHVTAVKPSLGTLMVSQAKLFESYKPGMLIKAAVVVDLLRDDLGSVSSVFLDLEPGISGRLHTKDVGVRELAEFQAAAYGRTMGVVVESVADDEGISLTSTSVFAGRQEANCIGEGQEFPSAVVQGFDAKSGERQGIFVEILPGVRGYLPRRRLGTFQSSWIQRYGEGEVLPVRVTKVNESGKFDLVPAFGPISAGFKSTEGYVTGFLGSNDPRFRYAAVFVEFLPGVEGFLHWRNAKQAGVNLDNLREGQAVNVVVLSTETGRNRCDLRLVRVWSKVARR